VDQWPLFSSHLFISLQVREYHSTGKVPQLQSDFLLTGVHDKGCCSCSSNGRASIAHILWCINEQGDLLVNSGRVTYILSLSQVATYPAQYLKLIKYIRHYFAATISSEAQVHMASARFALRNACQTKPKIYMGCCTSITEVKIKLKLSGYNTQCCSFCTQTDMGSLTAIVGNTIQVQLKRGEVLWTRWCFNFEIVLSVMLIGISGGIISTDNWPTIWECSSNGRMDIASQMGCSGSNPSVCASTFSWLTKDTSMQKLQHNSTLRFHVPEILCLQCSLSVVCSMCFSQQCRRKCLMLLNILRRSLGLQLHKHHDNGIHKCSVGALVVAQQVDPHKILSDFGNQEASTAWKHSIALVQSNSQNLHGVLSDKPLMLLRVTAIHPEGSTRPSSSIINFSAKGVGHSTVLKLAFYHQAINDP
jgi:hypothetical protein